MISLVAGPLAGAISWLIARQSDVNLPVCNMMFIVVWMAVWWITEAVEIGVTALLPFVLMPLMNIMKADDVAMQYMEQTIFLFIGGFFLAYAMEKWDLHHRIAYRILLITGNSPAHVLAGMMFTAYLISMWISNTATTLMLVAAATAIAREKELFDADMQQKTGAALLIGLAYSATIGGMATIVGTPTNMIFTAYWEKHYAMHEPISFLRWCAMGIPFSLLMLFTGFIILKKMFRVSHARYSKTFISERYAALGRVSREQKTVMLLFTITVILWFTRSRIDLGGISVGGWEEWFPKGFIKDSTVAILTSLFLFIIPSKQGGRILEWSDVKKLPYHIILLFGGGFAMAKGIEVSGLGDFLAGQLHFFQHYPLWVLIAALALLITLLSELASNVATITLMLPILASLSEGIGVDPLKLMLPATFAASFGFMLVIATAPNTIAYATGLFQSRQLLRTGWIMNLAGIIMLSLFMSFFNF